MNQCMYSWHSNVLNTGMAENRFRSDVLNAAGQNILDVALNSLYGITIINTGDGTTGLPDKYSYSMGLVVNRTPDSIWVVIWGRYTGTRFAVNHYFLDAWVGWQEI